MESKVQVGDELAFQGGFGRWYVYKVSKITPTGRVLCGPYMLNADLSVRGQPSRSCPRYGQKINKEVSDALLQQQVEAALRKVNVYDLAVTKVEALAEFLGVARVLPVI